jgi:type I restriction-modification system DNA methylase subunit
MLGLLVDALEEDAGDLLGRLFHELELGNKWTGQFFTPDSVCRMMAAMTFGEEHKELIAQSAASAGERARRRRRGHGHRPSPLCPKRLRFLLE